MPHSLRKSLTAWLQLPALPPTPRKNSRPPRSRSATSSSASVSIVSSEIWPRNRTDFLEEDRGMRGRIVDRLCHPPRATGCVHRASPRFAEYSRGRRRRPTMPASHSVAIGPAFERACKRRSWRARNLAERVVSIRAQTRARPRVVQPSPRRAPKPLPRLALRAPIACAMRPRHAHTHATPLELFHK